jgi:poly(hydroxyalkanoate) depolymerase family esterase
MNRHLTHVLAIATLSLGLLVVAPARAATLTEVTRSTWAGSVTLSSYVQMYIYVPDKLATKPPIVVSSHSCGSTATGQMGNITKTKAAADKNGFILILPDNPGQNCWDVGSAQSLKHDGGGDTQAVAQMVKYALSKYNGDATRVYAMGGSSGGMMTQALMAVYPDVFKAGHARAGVPAGCWADGYASSNQWSNNCAGGNTTKTAQQWGDLVRSMYPGYTGHRPRIQLVQGESDTTISYKNMAEAIKEWTNVLSLSQTPTSTDTGYTGDVASYDRQFWKNACGFTVLEAWSAPGKDHSMGYEETGMLKFFGLDVAVGGPDPEDAACSGDGGVVATGGVSGSGGTSGAGGAGGARDGGPGSGGTQGSGGVQGTGASSGSGGAVGSGGSSAGTGGRSDSGGTSAKDGSSSSGGAVGSGGNPGSGGTSATGGTSGSGGAAGTGGSGGSGGSSAKGGSGGQVSGGTQGSGGAAPQGGTSGSGGSTATTAGTSSNGCSYAVGGRAERSASQVATLLLATLGLVFRRRRHARR